MPAKSKTSKKSKRKAQSKTGKIKAKGKMKPQKDPVVDPVAQAATRARALQAHLYFQRAELNDNVTKIENAKTQQLHAEQELITFKQDIAEASAFAALQHEHTVKKLMDRLHELTTANKNHIQEKQDLADQLADSLEKSRINIETREAEIARLKEIIKESNYNYDRILNRFTDDLTEKLIASWDQEKAFIDSQEEDIYEIFIKNNFLPIIDEHT